MQETEEKKVIIDKERFNNLLSMLNSTDEQNHIVAFSAIEELDFALNRMPIVMLKKKAVNTPDAWRAHAPKTLTNIEALGFDVNRIITYKGLMAKFKDFNPPLKSSEAQFFFTEFEEYLKEEMHQLGYTYIKKINVELDESFHPGPVS